MKKILLIIILITPIISKAQIAIKLESSPGFYYGDEAVFVGIENSLGLKGHTVFPGLQWEIKGSFGTSVNRGTDLNPRERITSFGAGYNYLFGRRIYGSNYWSFYLGMNLFLLNDGGGYYPFVIPETNLKYNFKINRNIYVNAGLRTLISFDVGNLGMTFGITKYLRRNSRKF